MDATLIGTRKRQALHGCKACRPLNCRWAEREMMLHPEFRDGGVPAGFGQLRVPRESLDRAAPGVEKVSLRSDNAGCRKEVLSYCGEGGDARFGEIDVAVSVDVTAAFRAAGRDADRRPLTRRDENGRKTGTGGERAEACCVPNRAGHGRQLADHRFPAVREPLRERVPGDEGMLPFPVAGFAAQGRCKPLGVVTDRREAGDEVIRRHGERCGRSEEAHVAPKSDPAGGRMPSGLSGASGAWRMITVMAHNHEAAMKKPAPAPGPGWPHRRTKAWYFPLIALPGRVVRHAGHRIVRLPAPWP